MTTVAEWEVAAEALRDDGYSDEEIIELLGKPPTAARSRGKRHDPDLHTPPLSGPAPPREVDYKTSAGRRLLSPDKSPELLEVLEQFREEEARLESEIGSNGKNSRQAPVLARVIMSRGGKIKRLAEAMARLRGVPWWKITDEQRRAYVRLAEFAIEALEVVEADEARLKNTNVPRDQMEDRLLRGQS